MAKKQWQIFEEACLEYLQAKFGEYGDFKLVGGVDSTTSDIVVTLSNGVKFYIEVKEDNAQCSQFVLIPDIEAHGFVYSKRNKLPMNPFTKNIIGYMNENFDKFSKAGTRGEKIDPLLAASAGHIRYQHMMKGVEFFITCDDGRFILLPLSLFSYYFEIIGFYRTKKSGSSLIPIKDEKPVNDYLSANYGIKCIRSGDNFIAPTVPGLIGERFNLEAGNFIIGDFDGQNMYVRKLSNTQNGTVIFCVKLKDGVKSLPDEFFIAFMKMASR